MTEKGSALLLKVIACFCGSFRLMLKQQSVWLWSNGYEES